VRLDVPQHRGQGEPDQHARQASGVPRRRDHRCPPLPPSRTGRDHPAPRGIRAGRTAGRRGRHAPQVAQAAQDRWSAVGARAERRHAGLRWSPKSHTRLTTHGLLWPNGRTGKTDTLNLEAIGVVPNQRGQIEVDRDFRTTAEGVYAVGDVIGPPALASAAYVQGRYAAHHLIRGSCERAMIEDIPTGIYTSPEISSLGKTERELTEAGVPYEVGQSIFTSLARAQITGQTVGMLKLLFHRQTLQLLGVHCFGANASEISHIGQAIMSQPGEQNSLRYFVNSTFNYPTMAEAYR